MERSPRPGPSSAFDSWLLESMRRFEDAWKRAGASGPAPMVEDHLHGVEGSERAALLTELVALDREYRQRRGELPTPAEYEARFPADAERIRQAFEQQGRTVTHTDTHVPPSAWRETETLAPPGWGVTLSRYKDQASTPESRMPSVLGDGSPAYVGKYRVVERLGEGGQAQVFRAVHPLLPGRDVVVKWANASLPEATQRLLISEGAVLARLDDPGLVRIHDVDVYEGRPFVVMEYVPGRTLQQILKDRRPSPRQAAAWMALVAATLERVHRQGVCHRDLKPANILIDATGRPRLLDFGLALLDSPWGEAGAPREGTSGTFAYMAPEQANALADRIGPRTDVFGLGGVLYALLTGRPPYEGRDPMALWEQARQARVTAPREVEPGVPRALERICLKALAAEPEARYASAGRMGGALRAYYLRRPRLVGAAMVLGLAVVLTGLVLKGTVFAKKQLPPESSVKPQLASVESAPMVVEPLTGELTVRVWGDGPVGRQGLSVTDPRALPVRSGESVRVQARLSRPAYIYLLWAGSSGRVYPLFPWDPDRGFAELSPVAQARREVHFPEAADTVKEITGPSGIETVLLLARKTPLTAEEAKLLSQQVGQLPSAPLPSLMFVTELSPNGEKFPVGLTRDLGPGLKHINDPVHNLMQRLGQHFELIQAIRFAHQGKESVPEEQRPAPPCLSHCPSSCGSPVVTVRVHDRREAQAAS